MQNHIEESKGSHELVEKALSNNDMNVIDLMVKHGFEINLYKD